MSGNRYEVIHPPRGKKSQVPFLIPNIQFSPKYFIYTGFSIVEFRLVLVTETYKEGMWDRTQLLIRVLVYLAYIYFDICEPT